MDIGLGLAIGGAAFAVFLAACGSAWGIAVASEAAGGVLTEDPEKFGRLLVMIALPGTQGFYGFLGAFYIMMKINLLGGGMPVSLVSGLQLFFAGLPVGVVGLVSGYYQGVASAAGIHLVAKRPEETGKAIILPAMVETYAVLGLLATILLVSGIKV
jgi:V/A-type H+-transporting ATPase subunit K